MAGPRARTGAFRAGRRKTSPPAAVLSEEVVASDLATIAVDSLSDTIRIGPFDWRIEKRKIASPIAVLDTILHEIGHAIYHVTGLQAEDDEERIISAFGTGGTQVYRDNPWLAPWITRCLA